MSGGLLFKTAGESHGSGLLAYLEGLPFGAPIDTDYADYCLGQRQRGHGRSARQKLESDKVEILGGARRKKTLGGPLALWVKNADHRIDAYRSLSRPRPGHADLAGALKHETGDVADIMERASARETAARTAAGAIAAAILRDFGIEIFAQTIAIGAVEMRAELITGPTARGRRDASDFLSLDPEGDERARRAVDLARDAGDSLGGRFLVVAGGMPVGLGSHVQWDRRLTGRLAQALMSIPALKAFEVGAGRSAAAIPGSLFHDPILPGEKRRGYTRPTNNAGGLEGGISNGQDLVLTLTMKPIPTLAKPLDSIELSTGEAAKAVYERSDVCSVPAAAIVGEAMVALVLLDAFLERFGADSYAETKRRFDAAEARL